MKRLWSALLYSLSGIKLAFAHEVAFRQEVVLATVLLPAAWLLAASGEQLALMWFSVFLVLVIELANTAVEAAIDRMGEEHHPMAKKAKDVASAAVMLALVNCTLVWGCILFGR